MRFKTCVCEPLVPALLVVQWIALRPGRPRSTSRLAGLGTWSDVTGDDGSFFLEPMLTMVISQCQDYGMIARALRSGLLKTELRENY